jgi:hypothetical protein
MIAVMAVVSLVVIYLAARRFESVQRRRGLWDKQGPIHPTKGPAVGGGLGGGFRGAGMAERLEVTGQVSPRPIKRELPVEFDPPRKD